VILIPPQHHSDIRAELEHCDEDLKGTDNLDAKYVLACWACLIHVLEQKHIDVERLLRAIISISVLIEHLEPSPIKHGNAVSHVEARKLKHDHDEDQDRPD